MSVDAAVERTSQFTTKGGRIRERRDEIPRVQGAHREEEVLDEKKARFKAEKSREGVDIAAGEEMYFGEKDSSKRIPEAGSSKSQLPQKTSLADSGRKDTVVLRKSHRSPLPLPRLDQVSSGRKVKSFEEAQEENRAWSFGRGRRKYRV